MFCPHWSGIPTSQIKHIQAIEIVLSIYWINSTKYKLESNHHSKYPGQNTEFGIVCTRCHYKLTHFLLVSNHTNVIGQLVLIIHVHVHIYNICILLQYTKYMHTSVCTCMYVYSCCQVWSVHDNSFTCSHYFNIILFLSPFL